MAGGGFYGEVPVRHAACVLGFLALLLAPAQAQTPAQAAKDSAPPSSAAPAAKDKSATSAPPSVKGDSAAPPPGSSAEPPPPPDLARAAEVLDKANAALNDIETGLDRHNLSDGNLAAARQQIAPIADSVSATAEKITPQLAQIKARLDQLGSPPDDKSPPENPSVTEERAAQQQSFSNTDELLKRAKLLAVRADQLKSNIAARRRALFTRSLFQRSTSIANAGLWTDVWRETPGNVEDAISLFKDWASRVNARFDGWRRLAFWLALPALVLAYIPIARLATRVFARKKTIEAPSRFLKILGAWWIALVIAVPPIVLTFIFIMGIEAANLSTLRVQSIFEAIGQSIIRIALAAGVARGLFAPTRPNWRLPRIGDAAAARIVGVAVSVVTILSTMRVCEALNEAVDASLSFSVATRGLGVIMAAIALTVGFWRLGDSETDINRLGPPARGRLNWLTLLRGAALIAAIVVAIAVLGGYPTFASFFLAQFVWASGVVALYVMASILVAEAIGTAFKPTARFGNWLITRIGLQRNSLELFGVLLLGALRLTFFIIAIVAVLAPWGLQSAEVPFDLRAAFFGFKVLDVVISPVSIIAAAGIFGLAYATFHSLQGWLSSSLLPHTGLDAGLRNSITTSLGYVGFIVAAGFALGYLGFSVEKLAIVAGALSVGIGFGLQSIVNNFVSGLILLWERAVRVGDWIIVGGDQGFVRRINVRSTEIETIDRVQVIIPNSSLISGVVKNLVRNDRTGRIVIPVTVAGVADPDKVREVLFSAAKDNDRVLKIPAPQIFFTSMSGSSLSFELAAFVADVDTMARVRSDLHFEIFKQFKANGFFDSPAAAQKIELIGIGNLASPFTAGRDDEQDRPSISAAAG
jgi:potassium-dependent mechanosensitive channel